MTDYVCFDAMVVPMEWGDAVYTVLPLPEHVVTALGKTRRVEGEIADHPVNLAITRAPVIDRPFLWTGKSLLSRVGIEPGDEIAVRLRPAPDDQVEVAEDVAAALRASGCSEAWTSLTPGKRRAALHHIDTAKRADTRARRIAALVDDLKAPT